MRILRLTNSNDLLTDLPPEQMGVAIAEQVVRERTGEPVETVIRVAWPGPALPGIVDGWLDRYEPDVVFLRAPGFWVSYESVPLRLQRRLGPLGKWPGELGLKIGGNTYSYSVISNTRYEAAAFRWGAHLAGEAGRRRPGDAHHLRRAVRRGAGKRRRRIPRPRRGYRHAAAGLSAPGARPASRVRRLPACPAASCIAAGRSMVDHRPVHRGCSR